MTVYVDDYRVPAAVGRLSARWSHLFADTPGELHVFAARLGLRRAWFQPGRRTGHFHYDVTDSKRSRALDLGARPVRYRDVPEIMRARDYLAEHGGPLRILVTGSREWADRAPVADALMPYRWVSAVLVSGHARGADMICESVWDSWGKLIETHEADWQARGKAAGHIRNAEMTGLGAFRCHSFGLACTSPSCTRTESHITHGTEGCVGLARSAGISVREHGCYRPIYLATDR